VRSKELVPTRVGSTVIATSSSKRAGPSHSSVALTTITSKSSPNTSGPVRPSTAVKKRVLASSK